MARDLITNARLPSADPNRFFATNHLHSALQERSIQGGAITLLSQAAKFVLSSGATIVLARLLMPSDFGLVGMVSALTGVIATLGDLGLSSATIQRQDITHEQVSTLFWINLGGGRGGGCLRGRLRSGDRILLP